MWTRIVAAALFVASLPSLARGEDRALLIGVGNFADAKVRPLPGIDLDLRMARDMAEKMGFKPAQIRALSDAEATFEKIRAAVDEWLVAGAGPNDRALFYFSGHGSQIPDLTQEESDGQDEVLIAYDTQLDGSGLKNTVTDDAMHDWLAKMRAAVTYVFVDACHSGSVTKGLRTPASAVVKYYGFRLASRSGSLAAPKDEGFADVRVTRSAGGRYVSLTASADNEQSLASPEGSLFTRGLLKAVAAGAAARQLTFNQIQAVAADEIATLAEAGRVHHPQVDGDRALASANIFAPLAALPVTEASAWQQFETLVDAATEPLAVAGVRQSYSLQDLMEIDVTVNRPGYLNVLSISEVTGVPTVLFPNRMAADNQVTGPSVRLPNNARYRLRFAKPDGVSEERNLLVAFLTERPVNLYNLGTGAAMFRELSDSGTRSAKGAFAADVSYAAGKAVYVLK